MFTTVQIYVYVILTYSNITDKAVMNIADNILCYIQYLQLYFNINSKIYMKRKHIMNLYYHVVNLQFKILKKIPFVKFFQIDKL